MYLERPSDADRYRGAIDSLRGKALNTFSSLALISRMRE